MKTLVYNKEEYKAEKIVKTETDIIGYDLKGKELFLFRGISDFTQFILSEGEVFDTAEPTENEILRDYVLDLDFRLIMMELGI